MLRTEEPLTLVHHIKGADGDTYTCTTVQGSWYRQNLAAVTANGLQAARRVRCRVPTWNLGSASLAALAALVPGDKILRGQADCPDGATFAALGRTQGAATVLDVHDNTRGAFPHYYLEGAG